MMLMLLYCVFVTVLGGIDALRKFPSPPPAPAYCVVSNVTCQSLSTTHRICLTTHLSYTQSSTVFTGTDNITQNLDNLNFWRALRSVPECWAVVQPFLCSVYMPKCENGMVQRSSSELCKTAHKACQVVSEYGGWPEFLKCESLHFQPGCYPLAFIRQKYNRTSVCMAPLLQTKNPSSFYAGVKGCGLQCQNPAYTAEEHRQVHVFVAILGTVCLLCTLFAVLTFLIDWKVASKYPSLVLFFINVCFLLGTIGWLLQFSGLRESIVCRRDGAVRVDEPRTNDGQGSWCTVVFFIIYFFMMSGVMWFVVLAFSWYVNFQALGSPIQEEGQSRGTYFHLAWALPLVLTIVTVAISHIEGDSLSGICFVGYYNRRIRAGLVLTPVALAVILGMYFLLKGLLALVHIKRGCPPTVNTRATEKIRHTIVRLTVFICVASFLALTSFIVHIYIFTYYQHWEQSLKNYIVCLAKRSVVNDTSDGECVLSSRQSMLSIVLNILSFFGSGIAMSGWVWTGATYRTWGRFVRSKFDLPPRSTPDKRKKQKMIARVFAQPREEVSSTVGESMTGESMAGVSLASTHEDPVGLDIDVFSASSRPATRAMLRQRLSRRRHRNVLRHRRHSDSDAQSMTSYMSRRLSAESIHLPDSRHRNSFYSRHHGENGLDVKQWAKHAAKWTKRTKVKPVPAPTSKFHKQQIKLQKRHEAALERAARNSEVSSVISDGVSEISSAVFDRNLPLPPIGGSGRESRSRRPDYSIFMASSFAPGELRRLSDPLVRGLPDVVDTLVQPISPLGHLITAQNNETKVVENSDGKCNLNEAAPQIEVVRQEPLDLKFKRPPVLDRLSVVDLDDDDDDDEDISILEM